MFPALEDDPSRIAAAVQLSIAPIFLLAGIGAFLNVMTQRLGRVVDRARALESGLEEGEEGEERRRHVDELRGLDRRITLANRAIGFCSFAALLVCFVVPLLFVSQLMILRVGYLIALLFVATMLSLVVGLIHFLAEISVATRLLRIRSEFLRHEGPG